MSQANVEIVRRLSTPYEGQNLVPALQEGVVQLGPDYQPDAVLAAWAEAPPFQHLHPDIEWDGSATGMSAPARGPGELACGGPTRWTCGRATYTASWNTATSEIGSSCPPRFARAGGKASLSRCGRFS